MRDNIPEWERELRKDMSKKFKEKTYKLRSGGFSMDVDKQGLIDMEVAMQKEFRRLINKPKK